MNNREPVTVQVNKLVDRLLSKGLVDKAEEVRNLFSIIERIVDDEVQLERSKGTKRRNSTTLFEEREARIKELYKRDIKPYETYIT